MSNLTPQEEQRIRDNIKKYGVAVHNPNGWTYKTPQQKLAEAHSQLAKEVSEFNKQNGTNVKYDADKGIYL